MSKTISLVDAALECLKTQQQQNVSNPPLKKIASVLHWTGDLYHIIELIYALFYSECINNGDVTLKQIVETFEVLFNIKIRNYSHAFGRIRGRKEERLVFINRLLNKLNKAIEEHDQ